MNGKENKKRAYSGSMSLKERRRRRRNRRIAALLASVVCMVAAGMFVWKIGSALLEGKEPLGAFAVNAPTATPQPTPTATPIPTPEPVPTSSLSADAIQSGHALLVREKDGSVVWSKGDSTQRVWPASITKIMTALVALENQTDLTQTFTMPYEIYQPLFDENASMAGFWSGESPTIQDLLYGTMLPSGADAAVGLAIATAGSEDAFVQMMNEKAAALGMSNTHFSNVWGIHQEDHYSTPQDLMILLQAAVKNQKLKEIMSTATYTTQPLSAHAEGVSMKHSVLTNPLLEQAIDFTLLGGKTGFTDQAGLCLASFAQKGEESFLLVTTGAMATLDNMQPLHVQDAITIYSSIVLP